MTSIQKKRLINIYIILAFILSVTCLFNAFITAKLKSNLFAKFNIVSSNENLLVHYISVGQGDAIAINLPDGKIMLIDDGPTNSNVNYTNYLEDEVLNSRRNKKIDYLVLTHADMDHIGGTMRLLKNFEVEKIYMPKLESNTATYIELKNYVSKNCDYVVPYENETIVGTKYTFHFLYVKDTQNLNNSCPLIKLDSMGQKFLFTGDISISFEDEFVEKYKTFLDCDVLKVAHHGSNSSSGKYFLNAVSPEYSVISVGYNTYGHPDDDVLSRLSGAGSKVLRTDKDGSILFVVDDGNLNFLTDEYTITRLSLNYGKFIIVLEVLIAGRVLIIILAKRRKKDK